MEIVSTISFVIYLASTGAVQTAFTAVHHDGDTVVSSNTPAGCSALVVDATSAVMSDQKGWFVIEGALTLVPPSPADVLATAQSAQTAVIESAYQNAAYDTAIAYKGTTFWTDQTSQSMLTGVLVVFDKVGALPDGFMWGDTTGTGITMTLADLDGLAAAILARMNTYFWKHKTLEAQIAAATTVAAVQAIVW